MSEGQFVTTVRDDRVEGCLILTEHDVRVTIRIGVRIGVGKSNNAKKETNLVRIL
jgi:hypothetical protein